MHHSKYCRPCQRQEDKRRDGQLDVRIAEEAADIVGSDLGGAPAFDAFEFLDFAAFLAAFFAGGRVGGVGDAAYYGGGCGVGASLLHGVGWHWDIAVDGG
mmetsp:Transcript_3120/g.6657  ORF Transcript_3120/g.6657 Transcript_3120/m.6657 type:complete len:100 (-) Transcript_3120:290-589(-)